MARKENITVGLPKPVLEAVEKARDVLYAGSLDAQVRSYSSEARYSRALTIELLILEGLRKYGIDVVKT